MQIIFGKRQSSKANDTSKKKKVQNEKCKHDIQAFQPEPTEFGNC